jgi:broad specificity phosphatase PhoE
MRQRGPSSLPRFRAKIPLMRLYIIRHGNPDYELDDLTEAGHREAQALGKFFAREGLDEIYSSPLGRARRTAGYSAEATGLSVGIEDWAREMHELADQKLGIVIWDYDPNIFASMGEEERGRALAGGAWKDRYPLNHPQLNETLSRVEKGVDGFLARLGYLREKGAYRMTSPNERRVALFCHNGSGLTMMGHMLNIPLPMVWASFFFHTSSVTTLLFEERRPGIANVRCIGLSDLSHLRMEGIEPSTAGLKANVD